MRSAVCGVSLLALTFSLPALADCADDIAMVEQELGAAAAPAAGPEATATAPDDQADQTAAAQGSKDAAAGASEAKESSSPEEVVDEMVEEGGSVMEDGKETKFASGGLAEPRETWHSGDQAPEEHPALVHLSSAKEHLETGDEQGCLDDVGKARAEMTNEQDG